MNRDLTSLEVTPSALLAFSLAGLALVGALWGATAEAQAVWADSLDVCIQIVEAQGAAVDEHVREWGGR